MEIQVLQSSSTIGRANFSSLVYQTGQNTRRGRKKIRGEFEFSDWPAIERQWEFQLKLPFDPGFEIKALFLTFTAHFRRRSGTYLKCNWGFTLEAVVDSRLLHKLLGSLSKVAPKIFKSSPKVAYFTKKLLKSCFLSTQKNQFLLLIKVNLYLFIYFFLLADISIPTEMIEVVLTRAAILKTCSDFRPLTM